MYLVTCFDFFNLLDRRSLEFERIGKMAHLAEMYKEIEILRKEVEFQNRLAEHWEGRWKQEYSEKIELLHKLGSHTR